MHHAEEKLHDAGAEFMKDRMHDATQAEAVVGVGRGGHDHEYRLSLDEADSDKEVLM